ncbi:hypothetical protein OKW35_004600 [Paraburkholderia sp. MM5477-R1]
MRIVAVAQGVVLRCEFEPSSLDFQPNGIGIDPVRLLRCSGRRDVIDDHIGGAGLEGYGSRP